MIVTFAALIATGAATHARDGAPLPTARGTQFASVPAADQATPYKAGPGDRKTPDDRITPNEANAMREVIAKHFKDIDESEDVFDQTGELEPSWQTCSKIDYSAGCLEETNSLVCADAELDVLDALGVRECFPLENAASSLCKAVKAFVRTFDELTRTFPVGPAFAKHAVVGWTNKREGNAASARFGKYQSWREGGVNATWATNTSMGGATFIDLGPPYHYNAVTGWAMCDIARTVLQQNANQAQRASCAPTATLSALSGGATVHALRKATELFWAGGIKAWVYGQHKEVVKPCEYVYDQVPGMVPFPPKAKYPYQAVGLDWYWGATLVQAGYVLLKDYGYSPFNCSDLRHTTYALKGPWGKDDEFTETLASDFRETLERKYNKSHFTTNEVAGMHDAVSDVHTQMHCGMIFNNDTMRECQKHNLRDPSYAKRKTYLAKACDIVDNGGFVTFGMNSNALTNEPRDNSIADKNPIVWAAQGGGAVGHCEVPPLAPWDDNTKAAEDVFNSVENWPNSDHRVALTACVNVSGEADIGRTYVFTTWGLKIRMGEAIAIGTADDKTGVGGILTDFVAASRLSEQPVGQENNPPGITRCESISVAGTSP